MEKRLSKFILFVSLFIVALALKGCRAAAQNTEKADNEVVSVELSDNSYGLEYSYYHTGWWKDDAFYAYNGSISNKTIYSGAIEKEKVAKLLKTLDLKRKNLKNKLVIEKSEDGNNYYNSSKIKEFDSFLLYGKDTEEAVLIVTETGEIYLQGIHYTGDKMEFRKAFLEFIKEETADNEKQQKKLLQCYNEIVWE